MTWMPNTVVLIPISGGTVDTASIKMEGPKNWYPRLNGVFLVR